MGVTLRQGDDMNVPIKLGDYPLKKKRGKLPYYYPDKPIGSRCAWSCRWLAGKYMVGPDDWGPLEDLTHEEILYELEDLAAIGNKSAPGLLARNNSDEIRSFLREARNSGYAYREYLAPWNMPTARTVMEVYRPGWTPLDLGLETIKKDGGNYD